MVDLFRAFLVSQYVERTSKANDAGMINSMKSRTKREEARQL